jgi:hypothetical protein
MPIHENKEYLNLVIITSNMGVGDLVKEMLPFEPSPTPRKHLHLPRENDK